MERGAFESESLFAGTKRPEVFRRFRYDIGTQLHYDTSRILATNGDIEKHLRTGFEKTVAFNSYFLENSGNFMDFVKKF